MRRVRTWQSDQVPSCAVETGSGYGGGLDRLQHEPHSEIEQPGAVTTTNTDPRIMPSTRKTVGSRVWALGCRGAARRCYGTSFTLFVDGGATGENVPR